MTVSNALAGVAVNDLGTAASWYERVFNAPLTAGRCPKLPNGGSRKEVGSRCFRTKLERARLRSRWR